MQHSEILEALKCFPILESLHNDELTYLLQKGRVKIVSKSEFVYKQDEPSDEIFFLMKGVVKITSNVSDGREVIKMVVHPKALLSEQSFGGEKLRCSNAIAMTNDVTVLGVNISIIKELTKKNTEFAFNLIEFLGKKLKYTEDRLESLALNDARERIIQFLKINAQSFGQPIGYEVLLRHDFTQQDIANFTATSRQTVTTVMNDLKKRNQIYFKRKSILIRDIKALC